MTRVINFLGGPSAGKSTKALSLTAYLKEARYNVEYVSEYAKDLVWGENTTIALNDQLHVLGEQNHRMWRLLDKVDYIITDSPIIIQLYYVHRMRFPVGPAQSMWWIQAFKDMVIRTQQMYDNKYFFVERGNRAYIKEGRVTTEEDAKKIDVAIKGILENFQIPYNNIPHDYPVGQLADWACK